MIRTFVAICVLGTAWTFRSSAAPVVKSESLVPPPERSAIHGAFKPSRNLAVSPIDRNRLSVELAPFGSLAQMSEQMLVASGTEFGVQGTLQDGPSTILVLCGLGLALFRWLQPAFRPGGLGK